MHIRELYVLAGLLLMVSLCALGCGETSEDESEPPTPVVEESSSPSIESPEDTAGEPADTAIDASTEDTVDIAEPLPDTETPVPEPGATVRFTGIVQYWETDEAATDCTVCVHEQDDCSPVSATGLFTLNNVPAEANVVFTFNCENGIPFAFPLTSQASDTVGETIFVVREKASIDSMLEGVGLNEGFDIEKAMLLFQAGPESFPEGRGMPGVAVSYFGPDPGKTPYYMIPVPGNPGSAVGGQEVTSTSIIGQGFIPDLNAGKYLVTFNDADSENRICNSRWGWPKEGDEYPPNTFEVPLIPGYASMASAGCTTTNTVSATGRVLEFIFGFPLPDVEMCVNWERNQDGSFNKQSCESTDATGTVIHPDLPGDQQFLLKGQGNQALGYMSTIGTMETYTDNMEWLGLALNTELIKDSAGAAGLDFNPTKGHIITSVVNQYRLPLDGFSMKLLNSVVTPDYVDSNNFDDSALATTAAGLGIFFNVDPGEHTLVVEKEGVLCTVSSLSWYTKRGYTTPVNPATITLNEVVCLADPSPIFEEPLEPITPPSCSTDDITEQCMETCKFLTDCSISVCKGFQDMSEWELFGATNGTQFICEDVCKEADTNIAKNMCSIDTCNTMLIYGHSLNGDLDYMCDNGIPSLLDMAGIGDEQGLITGSLEYFKNSPIVQETLEETDLFTVLIPTDQALAAMDPATTNQFNTNEAFRESVLARHLITGAYMTPVLKETLESGVTELETGSGTVTISTSTTGEMLIDGAQLVEKDIYTANGAVHYIDKVLTPPSENE